MKNSMSKRKKANRSGKIKCGICDQQTFLEVHHINGRDIPNPNHPSNLVNICPTCHSEIHWEKIIIEGWAYTTSGRELFWHKKGEGNFTGKESSPPLIKKGK